MRAVHRIIRGVAAQFSRRQDAADLGEELRAFLDAAIEAKLGSGMSRADAERAALELGGAALARLDRRVALHRR